MDETWGELHDGLAFVTGTSPVMREPHRGSSPSFSSGSPRRGSNRPLIMDAGSTASLHDISNASNASLHPEDDGGGGAGGDGSGGADGGGAPARLRSEVEEARGEGADARVALSFGADGTVCVKVSAVA